MPRRRTPAVLLVLLAAPLLPRAAAQPQALPPEPLKRIKAATVYVTVETTDDRGTGSGFLVKADGKTGWVVTNDHVVTAAGGRPKIDLVFQSGTADEGSVRATVAGRDPDRDLAV